MFLLCFSLVLFVVVFQFFFLGSFDVCVVSFFLFFFFLFLLGGRGGGVVVVVVWGGGEPVSKER